MHNSPASVESTSPGPAYVIASLKHRGYYPTVLGCELLASHSAALAAAPAGDAG